MPEPALTRRGSVYYFRARVPKECIAAYGRAMVSISLHTSDKAEAKLRARIRRTELDHEMAALGRQSHKVASGYRGMTLTLTDADIENVCLRYRADRLARDELERISGIDAHMHQLDLDILVDGVRDLRSSFARGDLTDVYTGLNAYLREIDLRVPKHTPPYSRLARRFQEAEIDVYAAILKRRQGHAVDIPLAPLDDLTFDDIFNRWKKRRDNRPPKTVRAFEQAFEELKARCTAMTPKMLHKQDAVALRDKMLASGEMSRRTVSKLLGFLQAAFQCAVNDGALDLNPFKGVEVVVDDRAKQTKARLPFAVEQLQTMFSGPVYQNGFNPRPSLGNACYWLPLLALHSGARLEELAQLQAEDVRPHPEHGWHLVIHDEGQRQVKNAASVRSVPLHPELVKLGFLALVEETQTGRLFPALRPDKYGRLGTVFSTWFGKYLDSLEIRSPQLVFHSLRHTFVEVCKTKADVIDPEVREAMVGHLSPHEISETYGSGSYPLSPMAKAMRHVEFKGLDLSHLYRPEADHSRRGPSAGADGTAPETLVKTRIDPH